MWDFGQLPESSLRIFMNKRIKNKSEGNHEDRPYGVFSIKRFWKSLGFAVLGVKTVFEGEPNFKIHLLAVLVVMGLGCYCSLSSIEWALIVLACGMVLVAEIFNTSIEYLTDLVTQDHHPLAKKAKDCAAAAVLIAAFFAVLIGGIVFIPKLF